MNAEQTRVDENEAKFREMFAYATGLYANPGTHEGSCASYWGFLRRYPFETLRKAFKRAVDSSPEFFPSAARVRECADSVEKTAQLAKPDYSRPALMAKEFVPAIGAGHEQWVNEGANDLEKLGRMWQVESKAKGWDRGTQMPESDGLRRWKEFWATWDHMSASKTSRTSGMHQAGNVSLSTANGSSASRPSNGSSVATQSHGEGCACETCFAGVMSKAAQAGILR